MPGKNMRFCCDSIAQTGRAHIHGCPNDKAIITQYFISTHDEKPPFTLRGGFYNWLTENKYQVSNWREVDEFADLGDTATIFECDGRKCATVLRVTSVEKK